MKQHLRKAGALTLALLLAMSGCQSGGPAAANGGEALLDEDGRYAEAIELHVSKLMYPGALLPAGETPEDNFMMDYLKEKCNIDVIIDWTAEGGEYNNKLALNIASGSLPDLIYVDKYLTFRQMVDNDMLADLTDIYPKYRTETLEAVDATFQDRHIEAVTIDGKQLAIPGSNLGYGHDLLWLRSDWLENLGLEIPRTLEDLEAVLEAFVTGDPDGNGIDDTVGLVVDAKQPVYGYAHQFGLEPIFAAFDCFPKQWMRAEDGGIYYGSTDPRMKDALALLNDWYQRGLIDVQFPTRIGTGETDAVYNSGQSGVKFGPWSAVSNDIYINNEDATVVSVAAPVNANGEFQYLTPAPVSSMLVVNKNYEYPEAAMIAVGAANNLSRGMFDLEDPINKKYLDIQNGYKEEGSIDGSGLRAVNFLGGMTFDYYDVVPKLRKCIADYVETGSYEPYPGMSDYDHQQCETAKRWADGDRDVVGFRTYFYRYIGCAPVQEGTPIDAAYYFTTDSSPALQPTLEKLEDQMYLQIILGEKPVEYFDEFVSEWYALGGDTLIAEIEELV